MSTSRRASSPSHTLTERDDGTLDATGSPKSDAGQRTVAVPALLLPELAAHLAEFNLRHTGNQLAAEIGATTRELMRRMGHSTVRAAMR